MSDNWYEVWVDEGLPQPYVLLVLPDIQARTIVFDPKENAVVHRAASYDDARLWLVENDYVRVEGRMLRVEA